MVESVERMTLVQKVAGANPNEPTTGYLSQSGSLFVSGKLEGREILIEILCLTFIVRRKFSVNDAA